MADGIDLVLADHRTVEALFEAFAATPGDGTFVGRVVDALSAHDDAEQAALYPLVGLVLGDEALVSAAAAAHAAIQRQIDSLGPLEGPALVAGFDRLRELVAAHVAHEEQEILPALAAAATPQQLDALAVRFRQAKQRVG